MLKTRIVTASILLALFLLALFFLPSLGWAELVIVMVMQGTAEWARLSRLSGKAASVYWWLTLAVMLLIVWLDMQHPGQPGLWHLLIYGVGRRVKQPVRLDHLQPLVHHGGGIHRNFAPHHPVRMCACLLRRDVLQFG